MQHCCTAGVAFGRIYSEESQKSPLRFHLTYFQYLMIYQEHVF